MICSAIHPLAAEVRSAFEAPVGGRPGMHWLFQGSRRRLRARMTTVNARWRPATDAGQFAGAIEHGDLTEHQAVAVDRTRRAGAIAARDAMLRGARAFY